MPKYMCKILESRIIEIPAKMDLEWPVSVARTAWRNSYIPGGDKFNAPGLKYMSRRMLHSAKISTKGASSREIAHVVEIIERRALMFELVATSKLAAEIEVRNNWQYLGHNTVKGLPIHSFVDNRRLEKIEVEEIHEKKGKYHMQCDNIPYNKMSKDRVHFTVKEHSLKKEDVRNLLVETMGISKDQMKEGDLNVICRPSQFARFIILRTTKYGEPTTFLELDAKLVTHQRQLTVDCSQNKNTAVGESL